MSQQNWQTIEMLIEELANCCIQTDNTAFQYIFNQTNLSNRNDRSNFLFYHLLESFIH